MYLGGSEQDSTGNQPVRCGAVRLRAVPHGLSIETCAHGFAEDEVCPRHQPTQ